MVPNDPHARPDDRAAQERRARPVVPPPSAIDLGRGAWIVPSKIHWSFSRAGGPGGQHVNTTSSRATLRVRVDEIGGLDAAAQARLLSIASSWLARGEELVIHADEMRSQLDNREAALRRLRAVVTQAATVPKIRRKTKPTRGSKERRLDSKKREGQKKQRRGWKDD